MKTGNEIRDAGSRDRLDRVEEANMRFMILIKANERSEAGEMPSQEVLEAMTAYNEELVKAGVLLGVEGLHPSSRGARVKMSATKRTVVDGPFAEVKELIAGFWIIQAKSLEEAVEWARRIPNPEGDEAEIEIRQVGDAEDFGDALTPELRETGARLRSEIERSRQR